ncbi:MAG: (Fe-S)-binding protein [Candidatus Dadabacteria bacterium]|nr:(Fe-S)-binding protein [Candidatus Dadabacteria bacterium]
MKQKNPKRPIKVYIFITCLVDTFFPEVGESMVKVLKELGVEVDFIEEQTCCGQPAYNGGYQDDARAVAERFLSIFDKALNNDPNKDIYIVCPSGSCTSMVKVFYEDIFKNSPELLNKVRFISENTFEFSEFLVKVLKTVDVGAEYKGVITYHDSCHLLRELKIKDGPRELIKSVKGVKFKEMELHDACCGFGGTFSIKFPNVSVSMLDEKIECILNSGADTLVSSDMGCLMNIGGALSRRNIPIKVMHLAELLASRG